MDEYRQDIASYNPLEMKKKGAVIQLNDEEQLIGVYGVKGKQDHFTSFGFIVKVYDPEEPDE